MYIVGYISDKEKKVDGNESLSCVRKRQEIKWDISLILIITSSPSSSFFFSFSSRFTHTKQWVFLITYLTCLIALLNTQSTKDANNCRYVCIPNFFIFGISKLNIFPHSYFVDSYTIARHFCTLLELLYK